MAEKSESSKRLRGVVLSDSGWQRLQAAKQQLEGHKNGYSYTLEEISQQTGLSHNTLVKVQRREVPVDRSTLEAYFKFYGLTLQGSDYAREMITVFPLDLAQSDPINLQGPLPLGAPFYIERSPIETQCYEAALKPGSLIRIKAPWHMGKTSLITRILHHVRQLNFQTLILSLRLADTTLFNSLDRLLYWLCAAIIRDLEIPNHLKTEWDELFGANYNCTCYLEKHVLALIDQPLVLALDDVDVLFQYPAIANDFFALLRVWYEKAKYGDSSSNAWQKLRLIVAHSTEVYIPLNIHQSPFSVGLSIRLPELTHEQVRELARRHGLNWKDQQIDQLTALIGGNPYLVQVTLEQIKRQAFVLEQVIQQSMVPDGIYSYFLQRQLSQLQQYPELMNALMQVVASSELVELKLVQAFKLQSMGLIKVRNQMATPSCELYRQYFSAVFSLGRSHDLKLPHNPPNHFTMDNL